MSNENIDKFVNLHVHSAVGSLLDSVAKIPDIVNFAKENNQIAIALTDHGKMSGFVDLQKECDKAGIKAIHGCCLAGQPIYTLNGVKNIEDIKVGDMVLTHKGRFKKVVGTSKREYNGNIYGFSANCSNKFWLTDEHPILIARNNDFDINDKVIDIPEKLSLSWERADNTFTNIMNNGAKYYYRGKNTGIKFYKNFVCFPKIKEDIINVIDLLDYLPAWKYGEKDGKIFKKKCYGKSDREIQYNINRFLPITENFGRLLGHYISEGSLIVRKEKIQGIHLTFNPTNKKERAEIFINDMKKTFEISPVYQNRKDKGSIELAFNNIILGDLFYNMCGRYSDGKIFPNFIFKCSQKVKDAFLYGILSDASTTKDTQTTLKMTSKYVVYGTRLLMSTYNHIGKVHFDKSQDSRKDTYRMVFTKKLAEENKRQYNFTFDDKYIYLPLKSVEMKPYNGFVYNIQVEDDNSYVSDFVVHNCEIYEVDDMYEKNDSKEYVQPRYHLLLLAKNKKGLQNLFKIVSVAATEGFYKKPLITLDYIEQHNLGEGIICSSACMASRLSKALEHNEYENAEQIALRMKSIFENYYIEMQSHANDVQMELNIRHLNLAKKLNIPWIITTDAHMISKDQIDIHSVFIRISQDRDVGENYDGCYLQTSKDVVEHFHQYENKGFSFSDIKTGVLNTLEIANMVETIDIGLGQDPQMPVIDIPEGFQNSDDYMEFLVWKGFQEKFESLDEKSKQIREKRIKEEIPVLKALHYCDYFIMLQLLTKEAQSRHIPLGYSRGSGANCLCLYCLGVTQIDSVRWDLDFSRFANLGRKSMADYDMDIAKSKRKSMVTISEDLFGKDNVAPICTFNTLSTKVAIRDVGKVLNEDPNSPYYQKIPYDIRDEVAKQIPTVKTLDDLGLEIEKDMFLKDLLSSDPKLQKWYHEFPKWFYYVMYLEGLPKSMGRHAAGTIIAPKPVVEYAPLCYDTEGNPMLQIEMHAAMDDIGLIKMDFLGLETLDIVDEALKIAGLTWQDVDINHLNLSDKPVYDSIYKTGNTVSVFQMESAEARDMCIAANADNIEDIIAINAANRPGTKDQFPAYCSNKLKPDKAVLIHPDLREIFAKTNLILLYQEQALQLFRYADFPETEVDNARRAIGKKKIDVMEKLEVQFKQNLQLKGWTDEQQNAIWDLILLQTGYSFNRGHSVSYGLLSYLTAYLKYHYPVEFMTACMNIKADNISKLGILINESYNLGIEILPPDINDSRKDFTAIADKKQIRFGLLAIKGLGLSTILPTLEKRPYKDFHDFLDRSGATSKVVINFIKAGCFGKNKRELLLDYFDYTYQGKEFKPVKAIPTAEVLLNEWGIVKGDRKAKDESLIREYNEKRKIKFKKEFKEKYDLKLQAFQDKYMQGEYMWEFDTLSMFITDNPLKEMSHYVTDWELVKDGEEPCVLAVIVDIKRKKDKNNNVFAYLDLYTVNGIIEAIAWSSKYKKYSDLIEKGRCISILGRKNENKIFVNEIKSFEQWKKDRFIEDKES